MEYFENRRAKAADAVRKQLILGRKTQGVQADPSTEQGRGIINSQETFKEAKRMIASGQKNIAGNLTKKVLPWYQR